MDNYKMDTVIQETASWKKVKWLNKCSCPWLTLVSKVVITYVITCNIIRLFEAYINPELISVKGIFQNIYQKFTKYTCMCFTYLCDVQKNCTHPFLHCINLSYYLRFGVFVDI